MSLTKQIRKTYILQQVSPTLPQDLYLDICQGPQPESRQAAGPDASEDEDEDDAAMDGGRGDSGGKEGTPQIRRLGSNNTELDTPPSLAAVRAVPTPRPSTIPKVTGTPAFSSRSWEDQLLDQPCIFGLKEKIKKARACIAEAKSLEADYQSFGVVDVVLNHTPEKMLHDAQPDYPFAVEVGSSPASPLPLSEQDRVEKIESVKARIAELKAGLPSPTLSFFGVEVKGFCVTSPSNVHRVDYFQQDLFENLGRRMHEYQHSHQERMSNLHPNT